MQNSAEPHVILFDGICNLCNASVNFVLDHDRQDLFRFCTLQSEAGVALLRRHNGSPSADTFVLIRGQRLYLQSDAVLNILRGLGRPIAWTYVMVVVPRFLRDAAYSLVANHRYSWFGARQSCRVPDDLTMAKFL